MTLRINWDELAVNDINGRRLSWDVPHLIYKGTSSIPRDNPGEPIATLPPEQTEYIDEDVSLDTTYYYRIGELRPGGIYVSELQSNFMVKRHILRLEAVFLARELYGNGEKDEDGNLLPLEEFSGEIPNSWVWDGVGLRGEWLEYFINGISTIVKFRGNYIVPLGTITFDTDEKDYPPAMIDYSNPFRGEFYNTNDRIYESPRWWVQYWNEVDINNYPESWDAFWEQRRSDATIDEWYRNLWRL